MPDRKLTQLPSAAMPLTGNELYYAVQSNRDVKVLGSQIGAGGNTIFTATTPGIVPASGGGTINFLRADAVWAIPPGSGGGGGGNLSVVTPQQFGALGNNSGALCTLTTIQDPTKIGIYSVFDTVDAMGVQEAIYNCFAAGSTPAPANGIKVSSGGPSGGLTIAPSANTVGGVLGGNGTLTYYWDQGANYIQSLVEGTTSHAAFFNTSNHSNVNFWIQFDFRQGPVIVTEATWYQDTADTHGTFQWQGWSGSAWVNIGAQFVLGGLAQVQTTLNGNVTAYGSYRLLGITGNLNTNPFLQGIQFKQGGSYITTNRSTNVVWNSVAGITRANQTLYIPNGRYTINRQILTVAQNAEIWFQSKHDAQWVWTGDPNTAMWECDSLAYARVINPSFSLDSNNSLYEPFWDLNGTGQYGGLLTQQVTIDNMVSTSPGNLTCPYAMIISRDGGTAQGDTILFLNPFISGNTKAAILVNGQNALSIQVMNGDIQSCLKDGIRVNGGSLFCYGTSFQGEGNNFNSNVPARNQIRQGGYDFTVIGGAGGTVVNRMLDARSESDCVAFNSGGILRIQEGGNSGVTQSDWFANFNFSVGSIITPSTNNSKNRAFMVVDTGGPPDNYPYGWHDIDYAGSSNSTVKDAGAPGWSVNQWAGFNCGIRFGNSFVSYTTIVSNTANTLTLTDAIMDPTNLTILYAIVGVSGGGVPNFDSLQDSTILINFSGSFPWSVSQNSNLLNATGFSVGDFSPDGGATWNGGVLLAGEADQYGKCDSSDGYLQVGLVAQIIGNPGADQWTMNRKAGLDATTTGCGYGGRLLADGNLKWMHIPFPITLDVTNDSYNVAGGGRIYDGPNAESINMGNIPLNQLGLTSADAYGNNAGNVRNLNIKLALDYLTSQPITISSNPQSLGSFINTDTFLVTVSATGTVTCSPDSSVVNLELVREITIFWIGNFAGTITLGSGFRALSSPALTFSGAGNQMFCSKFILTSLFGTAQWVEVSRVGPT
jgi:hypothetical protein